MNTLLGFTPEDLSSEEAKKYFWSQVFTFEFPADKQYDCVIENEDEFDTEGGHYELDDRLIDSDMLMAEPEEADRIYIQLKERAMRRAAIAAKERRLRKVIDEDDEVEEEEDEDAQAEADRKEQSANKIKAILEKSSQTEKLDFTNGLLNFVSQMDRR